MRKTKEPTLENILKLFAKQLTAFSGHSRRGYSKAFSSFQVFVISSYPLDTIFSQSVVESWVVKNISNGLSKKTVAFYLDKVASLYSAVAKKLTGGKFPIFKNVKRKLSSLNFPQDFPSFSENIICRIRNFYHKRPSSPLLKAVVNFPANPVNKTTVIYLWSVLALSYGVPADKISQCIAPLAPIHSPDLELLKFSTPSPLSENEKSQLVSSISNFIQGEPLKWFALRLRPGVKYEQLLERFATLNQEIFIPEIFYPCEEITKRVGRKIIWKGRPFIRDVVFIKKRKSEIYPMISKIYDLAWCYRKAGSTPGNYAPISSKSMDDFKKAIGFLNPDFEISATENTILNPGDKVVIIDDNFMSKHATVIKKSEEDADGNIIYRVMLLNGLGKWDVGVDARFLKKETDLH